MQQLRQNTNKTNKSFPSQVIKNKIIINNFGSSKKCWKHVPSVMSLPWCAFLMWHVKFWDLSILKKGYPRINLKCIYIYITYYSKAVCSTTLACTVYTFWSNCLFSCLTKALLADTHSEQTAMKNKPLICFGRLKAVAEPCIQQRKVQADNPALCGASLHQFKHMPYFLLQSLTCTQQEDVLGQAGSNKFKQSCNIQED